MKHLAQFLRDSRETVVAAWLTQIEKLPSAAGKPWGLLRDHIPDILDQLAAALEQGETNDGALDRLAGEHAALRFRTGYDLRQVVLEYQALRQTILTLYAQSQPPYTSTLRPVTSMDRSLDEAIGDAVDRFMDERDKARDVFVGILGHDLRTPLQTISIAADLFLGRQDVLPPPFVAAATSAKRAAHRMERMIEDLLDFARGRLGGGIPITPTDANLRAVARGIVDELAAGHPDRSIACLAVASGDFDGQWDAPRIGQAISNLVANAIEHGGDPIEVETLDQGEHVRVEVRNAGTIPDEIRPTLLQPFHRGKSGTGLGLGLYVVDEIARAHGGRVDIESTPERGTRVSLVLPRQVEIPTKPRRTP